MFELSFTNAPLIGAGQWIGLANYRRMFADRVFWIAILNTTYFVLLTVVPGTAAALAIALMAGRLTGRMQSVILAMFFLPYVLPVTVVYLIWNWLANPQFGVAAVRHRAARRPAHQRLADHPLVHALRRAHHDLVDERPSRSCFFSPACATSRASSMKPPPSMGRHDGRRSHA